MLNDRQIAEIFFRFGHGEFQIAKGEWRKCSPDWAGNGSVGSTEFVASSERLVKVKRGEVSFEFIDAL